MKKLAAILIACATTTAHAAWRAQTHKDQISGEPFRITTLLSAPMASLSFPYRGTNRAEIAVVETNSHVTLLLGSQRGQLLCHDRCVIRAKLDNAAPITFRGSKDINADYISLEIDDTQLWQLLNAKKALIELDFYRDGLRVATFSAAKPAPVTKPLADRLGNAAKNKHLDGQLSATPHRCYELEPAERNDCIDAVRACLAHQAPSEVCAQAGQPKPQ